MELCTYMIPDITSDFSKFRDIWSSYQGNDPIARLPVETLCACGVFYIVIIWRGLKFRCSYTATLICMWYLHKQENIQTFTSMFLFFSVFFCFEHHFIQNCTKYQPDIRYLEVMDPDWIQNEDLWVDGSVVKECYTVNIRKKCDGS